jgi:hypothetical protein
MAIGTTDISINSLKTEWGSGSGSLGAYWSGGGIVIPTRDFVPNVPTSFGVAISLNNFASSYKGGYLAPAISHTRTKAATGGAIYVGIYWNEFGGIRTDDDGTTNWLTSNIDRWRDASISRPSYTNVYLKVQRITGTLGTIPAGTFQPVPAASVSSATWIRFNRTAQGTYTQTYEYRIWGAWESEPAFSNSANITLSLVIT